MGQDIFGIQYRALREREIKEKRERERENYNNFEISIVFIGKAILIECF